MQTGRDEIRCVTLAGLVALQAGRRDGQQLRQILGDKDTSEPFPLVLRRRGGFERRDNRLQEHDHLVARDGFDIAEHVGGRRGDTGAANLARQMTDRVRRDAQRAGLEDAHRLGAAGGIDRQPGQSRIRRRMDGLITE